jgi:hypothetical protein
MQGRRADPAARAARRGFAGLAYAIVLVPVVLVIWFLSSLPRGPGAVR